MGKQKQKQKNVSPQQAKSSAEYFFEIASRASKRKQAQPDIGINHVKEPSLITTVEQLASAQPKNPLPIKEAILTTPNSLNQFTPSKKGLSTSGVDLEKLEAHFIKQNAKLGSKKKVTQFATQLVTQYKDSSPGKTISNTIKNTLPHAKTIGVLCWIGEESQKQGFAQKKFNEHIQFSLGKDKKGSKRAFKTYMLFFYLEALADASEVVFNQIIAKGIDKAYFAVEPYIKRLVKEISKRHAIPKDPFKSLQVIFQNTQRKYIKKHQCSPCSNSRPLSPPIYKKMNTTHPTPPVLSFPVAPMKSMFDIQKESERSTQAVLNRLHERQKLTSMHQQLNSQKHKQAQSYQGITHYHKSGGNASQPVRSLPSSSGLFANKAPHNSQGVYAHANKTKELRLTVDVPCGGTAGTNPNYNSRRCVEDREVLAKNGL